MDDIEELKVAAILFVRAENAFQDARDSLSQEVEAKGYDVSVGTVTDYARASRAWDKADKRLVKAAKRIITWK